MTEKVLARRPGDLHALEDRFFAVNRLALLADGRHDAVAAASYATEGVQAAQDWVRFNPSDLGAWARWAQALAQVATFQYERGEVSDAIATGRSALALAQDPRSPKGLAAVTWYIRLRLARALAERGEAGAEQSAQAAVRNLQALVADRPPDSPQRRLAVTNLPLAVGNIKLAEGSPQFALTEATAARANIEPIEVPVTDAGATRWKNQNLENSFNVAARAAVRLGRYAQAETSARQWLAVVPNSVETQTDPKPRESQARYILAQAIAMQGRAVEARDALQPALTYYAGEQKAGAQGTTFRHDYAYALYVDSLTAPAGAAGAKQRKADLDQAAKLIAGASAEAQRLTNMRYVSSLIAAARAGSKG